MNKRIWSILLVLCMVLALLPFSAFADRQDLTPYAAELKRIIKMDTGAGNGTLADLDKDGIPELFMAYTLSDGSDGTQIYTIRNGQAVFLLNSKTCFGNLSWSSDDYEEVDVALVNGEKRVVVQRADAYLREHDDTYGDVYLEKAEFWIYALRGSELQLVDQMSYVMLTLEDGRYFVDESEFTRNNKASSDEEIAQVLNSIQILECISMFEGTTGYPLQQVLSAVEGGFMDVPISAYYFIAVDWAVANGITDGTSDYLFSPNQACTRGQIVTFLWRAAGSPEPKSANNPFKDVKASDYFYKAVLWAVEKGITDGTSATTFSPASACTRGQVVTFLYRYAGSPKISAQNPFKDVKTGAYYFDPVLWAVKNEITDGTSATTFSPNQTCTRGQIVTFLYRSEMHK